MGSYRVLIHENDAITVSVGGHRVATMISLVRARQLGGRWVQGRGTRRKWMWLETEDGLNLGSCLAEHYPAAIDAVRQEVVWTKPKGSVADWRLDTRANVKRRKLL